MHSFRCGVKWFFKFVFSSLDLCRCREGACCAAAFAIEVQSPSLQFLTMKLSHATKYNVSNGSHRIKDSVDVTLMRTLTWTSRTSLFWIWVSGSRKFCFTLSSKANLISAICFIASPISLKLRAVVARTLMHVDGRWKGDGKLREREWLSGGDAGHTSTYRNKSLHRVVCSLESYIHLNCPPAEHMLETCFA